MKKFLAIMLTVCLLASMFTFAAVADPSTEPLTIIGATLYDANTVIIHFSEAIDPAYINGNVWASVSLKDANGSCSNRVGLTGLTAGGDGKSIIAYNYTNDLLAMYNKTGDWSAYADGYTFIASVDNSGLAGFGDGSTALRSTDGARLLAANGTLTFADAGAMPCAWTTNSQLTPAVENVTITSDTAMVVEFENDMVTSGDPWAAFYFVNKSTNQAGSRIGVAAAFNGGNGTLFNYNGNDLVNLYNRTGAYSAYPADEFDLYFALDYLSEGSNPKFSSALGWALGASGPVGNAHSTKNVTYAPPVYPEVEKVEIVAPDKVNIYFENEVQLATPGTPWAAFYYVDGEGNVVTETGRVGVDQPSLDASGKVLSFRGTNLVDLYNNKGSNNLVFAFDHIGAGGNDYVYSVATNTPMQGAAFYDSTAYVCENVSLNYIPPVYPEVEKVEIVAPDKVNIYFENEVQLATPGTPWAAFYYVDGEGNVVTETGRVGVDQPSLDASGKVLSFRGTNLVNLYNNKGSNNLVFAFDHMGAGGNDYVYSVATNTPMQGAAFYDSTAYVCENVSLNYIPPVYPEVEKVEIVAPDKVNIYFENEVQLATPGTPWAAFYYVDGEGNVVIETGRVGVDQPSLDASGKVLSFRGTNLVDLYNNKGSNNLVFAFDHMGAGGNDYVYSKEDNSNMQGIAFYDSIAYVCENVSLNYIPPVYPEITGVEIVNENNLTITFDTNMNSSVDNDGPWAAFYLVDKATGALVEGVGDAGGSRIGVAWKDGISGTTINYKSDYNLVDLFYRDGAFKDYGADDYDLYFAVDNMDVCPINFANDIGVKLIANTVLAAVPNSYATDAVTCGFEYDSVYDSDLEIEEVSFINSGIVVIEFSEEVEFDGQPWGAFYFRDKDTGDLVGERIGMAYRNESAAGNLVYYVSGSDVANPTKDAWNAYNRTGAYETYTEDKYDLVFTFDNYNVAGNGTVASVESGLLLSHNASAPGNGKAHACDNITDSFGFVDPAFAVTEGFRVVSATAINDKQIVIEMSEPVHMVDPYAYISLRYTDNFGYLMMDGSTPLQFDGLSVISGDGMRITWTINEKGNIEGCNNVIDAVTFAGKLAKYSEYVPMMSIEEIKSIDDNGTIANVYNDAGEELIANRVYSKAEGGADAAYVPVVVNTKWEDPGLLPLEIPAMPEGPHIVKAVAVNDKQLVVEFSEPITFVDPYGFMSIRYVDRNFNLGFEDGNPLQFYGAAVVSLDRTSLVWTLADEGNIAGADNLADILNRTGKLAKYKDYYPVFGLEEITANGKGDKDALIENVVNDKGEKLVANCPTDLGYDRVYVSISVDTKYQIPDTSDNVNVYLLCAGIAVSVILAGAVVIKRKRTQA